LNIPRYKLIVQSVLGQQKQQGARVASRCLWDTDVDGYSTYYYQSDALWATVMLFAFYTE
jgi:tctex1 domain-containing protein 2